MTGYTLEELATATGATRKQLDHWTRAGYLRPDPRTNTTKGSPRIWSDEEQAVCVRMLTGIAAGLSVPLAHDAARQPDGYTTAGITVTHQPNLHDTILTALHDITHSEPSPDQHKHKNRAGKHGPTPHQTSTTIPEQSPTATKGNSR